MITRLPFSSESLSLADMYAELNELLTFYKRRKVTMFCVILAHIPWTMRNAMKDFYWPPGQLRRASVRPPSLAVNKQCQNKACIRIMNEIRLWFWQVEC